MKFKNLRNEELSTLIHEVSRHTHTIVKLLDAVERHYGNADAPEPALHSAMAVALDVQKTLEILYNEAGVRGLIDREAQEHLQNELARLKDQESKPAPKKTREKETAQ